MDETVGANWFAYTAILAWPLVALALYNFRPFSEATAWTVLGALLFLPSQVAIKFPMIPAIDKTSVANISALLGCAMFAPRLRRVPAAIGVVALLAIVYIASPVVTSVLNNDDVVAGPVTIPGVGYYDGISALLSQSIMFLTFFAGLRFLARAGDTEALLRVLVVAGLVYSLLMLFEIRMSPQLSRWIYGIFSSSFATETRYGGFRPVVFMINGLAAAFFLSTAVIGAAAFWRARIRVVAVPSAGVSAYLGVVLILCKSAGALIYAVLFGALVRWFTPKVQMRLAVVLTVVAVMYPVLRMNNFFPTEQLVEAAAVFNRERADSLKFRFDQEQQLLAHASERFWFGWGRYGRNRVYEESGKDTSITDGQWILTFGQFGFFGFMSQFGLLTLPVFYAARTYRLVRSRRQAIFLCCLTLLVAISVVEQIPNASISAWTWLLAGALLGRCAAVRAEAGSMKTARSLAPAPSLTPVGGTIGSHRIPYQFH